LGNVFPNEEGNELSQTNILKRYLHPILIGDEKTPGVTGRKMEVMLFVVTATRSYARTIVPRDC
jgi:hypothetical protein